MITLYPFQQAAADEMAEGVLGYIFVEVKGVEDDEDEGRWAVWPHPLIIIGHEAVDQMINLGVLTRLLSPVAPPL